jgi:hypothetical protein
MSVFEFLIDQYAAFDYHGQKRIKRSNPPQGVESPTTVPDNVPDLHVAGITHVKSGNAGSQIRTPVMLDTARSNRTWCTNEGRISL